MPRVSRRPAKWRVIVEFVRTVTLARTPAFAALIPGHRGRAAATMVLSILLAGLLQAHFANAAADYQQPGSQLTIIRSTPASIVVALTVERYEIEPLSHDGEQYHASLSQAQCRRWCPARPRRRPAAHCWACRRLKAPHSASSRPTARRSRRTSCTRRRNRWPKVTGWTLGEQVRWWNASPRMATSMARTPSGPARSPSSPVPAISATSRSARSSSIPLQFNPVRREIRICRRIVAEVAWRLEAQPAAAADEQAQPRLRGLVAEHVAELRIIGPTCSGSWPRPTAFGSGGRIGVDLAATAGAAPVLKIGVSQDGLYKLTYTDLSKAGFSPATVDPRTITISNQGSDIPIIVQGEGDGRFDSGDAIFFYGKGIRDAYTTTNVYWLSAGTSPGRRMTQRDGHPSGAAIPAHFPALST